jgi:DNA-binding NarL/FixJ family response regulator
MKKLTYEDAEMIRLFRTIMYARVAALAHEYQVSESTIENIIRYKYFKEANPKPTPRTQRIYTDDEVREIRRLATQGISPYIIAKRLGKHQTTVRQVVEFKSYKEIT